MVDGLEYALDSGAALDGCALEFGVFGGECFGLVDGAFHPFDIADVGAAVGFKLVGVVVVGRRTPPAQGGDGGDNQGNVNIHSKNTARAINVRTT